MSLFGVKIIHACSLESQEVSLIKIKESLVCLPTPGASPARRLNPFFPLYNIVLISIHKLWSCESAQDRYFLLDRLWTQDIFSHLLSPYYAADDVQFFVSLCLPLPLLTMWSHHKCALEISIMDVCKHHLLLHCVLWLHFFYCENFLFFLKLIIALFFHLLHSL